MRIMAVDDEHSALEYMLQILRKQLPDAQTVAFSTPTEALEYVRTDPEKHGVDVAFLDIELPGMSGIELAKHLKQYLPMLNIVFVTGYKKYAVDAYDVFPSGYLLKPFSEEKLVQQMQHLRSPIAAEPDQGIRAQTFGQFELYVNGVPVHFSRSKSRELLAYLIDSGGKPVSAKQLRSVLLEKEYKNPAEYMRQLVASLRRDLKSVGAEHILRKEMSGRYYADKTAFSCDLYEYMRGEPLAISTFHGRYMEEYSWGEFTLGKLYGMYQGTNGNEE